MNNQQNTKIQLLPEIWNNIKSYSIADEKQIEEMKKLKIQNLKDEYFNLSYILTHHRLSSKCDVKNWTIENKAIVFNLNHFSSNLSTKGSRHSKDKLECYVRYTTDKSVELQFKYYHHLSETKHYLKKTIRKSTLLKYSNKFYTIPKNFKLDFSGISIDDNDLPIITFKKHYNLTVPDKKTYIEYKNNNCFIPNDTQIIKQYIKDVENRLIQYSKNKVLT
jgi:hypothetical protein